MNFSSSKFKKYLLFTTSIFVIGGFGSLIVHKYVAPYLSSKPVFRHIGFLSPNSPLVITRTEQVRINENVNIRNLIKQVSPRVVTVLAGSGKVGENFQELSRQGGIVLSSDGIIATDKALFANTANTSFAVVLSDGRVSPLTFLANDPASSLAFGKVAESGLSAVNFGSSQELELGHQLIALSSSERISSTQFRLSHVTSLFSDANLGTLYASEGYPQMFTIDTAPPVGSALFNLNGQLVGLVAGGSVVPGEVVRSAQDIYFASQSIIRPYLGIHYAVFSKTGSQLLGLPVEQGALVTGNAKTAAVTAGSPAARAGILDGDIISKINNEPITLTQPLSSFLNRSRAGETLRLTIVRGGQEREFEVVLGELK